MTTPTHFREQIGLPGQTHVADGPTTRPRCLIAYQVFLLAVTATVGGLAVARAVVLARASLARLRV